ncbi:MAG: winged helix-turn-helix transcriptional regulator [Candidatus Hodarchaeota archaeon]
MSQPDISKIINSLNHEIRRGILELISSSGPTSYTKLLEHFDLSTGKLNYHLKLLKDLVEKDDKGIYHVSELGLKSMEILKVLKERDDKDAPKDEAKELDEQAQKILDILQEKIEKQQSSPYSPLVRKKLAVAVVIGLVVLIIAGLLAGYEYSLEGGGSSSGEGEIPWIILVVIILNLVVVVGLVLASKKLRKKRNP